MGPMGSSSTEAPGAEQNAMQDHQRTAKCSVYTL